MQALRKTVPAPQPAERPQMGVAIVGHVDHGKSSVLGRLLADTGSLPEGKLEAVQRYCKNNSRPFEYAFLIDALKDERKQGITIDSARVFFKSASRDYIIIDAPGHIEFVRNMITGASRADAALLVIDAKEGVKENSLRHGYFLSLLGIKQITVLINKMDLVGFDRARYEAVKTEYETFLSRVNVFPKQFIPVSALDGVNLATRSDKMTWYRGPSVLEVLDGFPIALPAAESSFRMPVQAVYKFTESGDQRRIVAGTVESGEARPGDEIQFFPSGKKSRIKRIEAFNDIVESASAGNAVGFTLETELYVRRGEIATLVGQTRPQVGARVKVSLFWLDQEPVRVGSQYEMKIGTAAVPATVESIESVFDAGELKPVNRDHVGRFEIAQCTLSLKTPIAFDRAEEMDVTSRFVLVHNYRLAGGGRILAEQADAQSELREKVFHRETRWEGSAIGATRRAERYNQKGSAVLITGRKGSGRQRLAEAFEKQLFADGRFVYYLRMGNVVHGLDLDIESNPKSRPEHIRRLAELIHLFVEAGMLLVVTAAELTQEELETIQTIIGRIRIQTVWLGPLTTDFEPQLHFSEVKSDDRQLDNRIGQMKSLLRKRGIIFDPTDQ